MGDRCNVELTVPAKDRKWWEERYFYCDDSEGCDPIDMYGEEMNYGAFDDLSEAAKTGLVFLGRHSPGDTYDAMEFACDGVTLREADVIDGGGYVLQTDKDTGEFSPLEWANIKGFIAFRKKVEGMLCTNKTS
jgi:hypothetical protein